MFDLQEPLVCGTNMILNNLNIIVLGISLIIFFVSFRKVRNHTATHRTFWLYLNAVSFIFPILFLIFSATCAPAMLTCHMNSMLYAIPLAIVGASLIFFVAVSQLVKIIFGATEIKEYGILRKVSMYSNQLCIKTPKIYLISEQKPLSFSSFGLFRHKIFFSVGLFELLSSKELESVILHELYHIKKASSFSKFVTYFLRVFSPMLHFSGTDRNLSQEEEQADRFAIKLQKTNRYLSSAKRKISEYGDPELNKML